ncbi:ciliogenesis-associated TTC17-interacting protein [Carettochelys insculpta]|uniref:ciliogenesis-associated TTC17-interacting protein n=1 Tax=Carettochelys insculpta TaxID=44489 RepID=UPI003EB9C4F7
MDDPDSPAPVQRVLAASQGAAEFLSLIGAEELQPCLFAESLAMVSESGQPLGQFSVTVQPACYEVPGGQEEDCYLVRATSQGTISDVPCSSSLTAYISKRLETLEQYQLEHVKFRAHPLDRRTHVQKRGGQLVVQKVIKEGELEVQTQSFCYSCTALQGLVSEAANLLVLRVLARRRAVPQNAVFLAFDTEARVCASTYAALGFQRQLVGTTEVEVFGIERAVRPDEGIPVTWQFYFLSDGHLARRVQVGSPAIMLLLQMPVLIDLDEAEPRPVFEKKPLDWEEDALLYSQFLDRKEELQAGHASYARRHPELSALLGDFLQHLLLRKPDDVVSFAAEFFAPFAAQCPPGSSFQASDKPSPFRSLPASGQ